MARLGAAATEQRSHGVMFPPTHLFRPIVSWAQLPITTFLPVFVPSEIYYIRTYISDKKLKLI